MRQAGGQGDGGEFLTTPKSPVPDMRQTGGQGDLRLIRQECNQPLALYIYQTAVLEREVRRMVYDRPNTR